MAASAYSLMVLGTAASVGKSLVALALCRWLYRQGKNVAPFKAINVAVQSFQTTDGGRLNIAQAQQAVASGSRPASQMNPVLFDLTESGSYHVLKLGHPVQDIDNLDLDRRSAALRPIIEENYRQLASLHDIIVIEGCGSPVEMNIKDRDISNLWLAEIADSRCILVADIERCGVFASLLGTLSLMNKAERKRIAGFIINKYHGSVDDFADGIRFLETHSRVRCLGVIPRLSVLKLEHEDWMDLVPSRSGSGQKTVKRTSFSKIQLQEVDRWTDHVLEHCDEKLLRDLIQ